MKEFKPFTLFLCAAILFAFSSCGDGNRIPEDTEAQTSIDNSFASSEFSTIMRVIDAEARADTNIFKTGGTSTGPFCFGSFVNINLQPANPVLTIDFGASGSLCVDGRIRRGELVGTFYGRWGQPNSSVIIVPDGYSVNGFPMTFVQTITYKGTNIAGNHHWDATIANGQIYTQEGTIFYECTRNTEQIAGYGNLIPDDNQYLISGTATGTSRYGLDFTAETVDPLHIKMNCSNIVAGSFTVTPLYRVSRTISFGNGNCDNLATLTVEGFTFDITLP